jgi:hypothetical protein
VAGGGVLRIEKKEIGFTWLMSDKEEWSKIKKEKSVMWKWWKRDHVTIYPLPNEQFFIYDMKRHCIGSRRVKKVNNLCTAKAVVFSKINI